MTHMPIRIPELSLVVLVGASGSGKTTFARKHFAPTEVLSSDFLRGLLADDEGDQTVTREAFEVLHFIVAKRLAAGRLTVIDATNVQTEPRKALLSLARRYHVPPVAIVFNLPESVCRQRNEGRSDRTVSPGVICSQARHLAASLRNLKSEGFHQVHVFSSEDRPNAAGIEREPMRSNRKADHGPFDVIGDVHGCLDELVALLAKLGHEVKTGATGGFAVTPPAGRKAVFLGDLVNRGPNVPGVLRLVMSMVHDGAAYHVPGNHELRLLWKLSGQPIPLTHGLAQSVSQLEPEPAGFRDEVVRFLPGHASHYVFDDGKLVVAHAGMKAGLQGRLSKAVREFALYGDSPGEIDGFKPPGRRHWAATYHGAAVVVYGHTAVAAPEWVNRTINIDTGCVFGGQLTALRYPERELLSVPARRTHYALAAAARSTPAPRRASS